MRTIKTREGTSIEIEQTQDGRNKPDISVRTRVYTWGDAAFLTPAMARRVAEALIRAAEICEKRRGT